MKFTIIEANSTIFDKSVKLTILFEETFGDSFTTDDVVVNSLDEASMPAVSKLAEISYKKYKIKVLEEAKKLVGCGGEF